MKFARKSMIRLVLAGLAGFGVGAWLAANQRAVSLAPAFSTSTAPSAPLQQGGPRGPFQNEEEAASAIFSTLQEKDPLRRGYDLFEAIQRLDAPQVAALTAQVAKLNWSVQEQLIDPLLMRWAELDREAATAWARPFLEHARLGNWSIEDRVLNAWCRAAPEQALVAALKRPYSDVSAAMIYAATCALAGDNPAAQIDRLDALPAGRLRDDALATGLLEWAKKDAAAAYAQLARLGRGRVFENVRERVLKEWVGKDSAAALAQLNTLVPGLSAGINGSGLVNQVVRVAAETSPATALEWASSLPDSLRLDATAAGLVAWAPKEPIAALEWARSHGIPLDVKMRDYFGEGRDLDAAQPLISAAMEAEGDKTIEWLRDLPRGEERGWLLARAIQEKPTEIGRALFSELPIEEQSAIAGNMASGFEDIEAGLQWAQNLAPRGARLEVIAGIALNNTQRFPNAVEAFIDNFAPGPDRDSALRGYVGAQWNQPEKGIEIAARIMTPDIREQAFRQVASSWLYRDAVAAQSWLATTSELTPETKAILLRTFRESQAR
jgi:hypothetical protein